MKQYHEIELILTRKAIESGYIEVESPKGYKTIVRIVDDLPQDTKGVRVYARHNVVLVPSDIEELTKPEKGYLKNDFGGQTTKLKFITPNWSKDNKTPKKSTTKKTNTKTR